MILVYGNLQQKNILLLSMERKKGLKPKTKEIPQGFLDFVNNIK